LKVITFNAEGLSSASKRGLFSWVELESPDIFCVQDTRTSLSDEDVGSAMKDYLCIHNPSSKGGSFGTVTYLKISSNIERISVGLSDVDGAHWAPYDAEGRVIYVEYAHAIILNVSVPSGASGSDRQSFKLDFLNRLYIFMKNLMNTKKIPVIICASMNIAHTHKDLKNWMGNQKESGFLPAERTWLDNFRDIGYVDVFRSMNSEDPGYTYWENRNLAYFKDVGWRMDYQFATSGLAATAISSSIYSGPMLSRHSPLTIYYQP